MSAVGVIHGHDSYIKTNICFKGQTSVGYMTFRLLQLTLIYFTMRQHVGSQKENPE